MNSTGLRFGAYEIETLLGPGGVAETYRAHKAGAGDKPVALKLLRADRGGGEAKVAMIFKNLAFRNRQLDIVGLVPVLDVSLDPTTVFIVSQLVDGMDMEALWDAAAATGAVPPDRVADIGCKAAKILADLHGRPVPIIHGGLCPGNVLMKEDGGVVISDIGYSAALRNLTEFAIDKWWYVAPELLRDRGAKPTPASDVYSLGAVLYFLLAGEAPAMADTHEDLLEALNDDPPPIVGAPDWLSAAVSQMLARDPSQRVGSAAEVKSLLSAAGGVSPAALDLAGVADDAGEDDEEALPSLDLLDGPADDLGDDIGLDVGPQEFVLDSPISSGLSPMGSTSLGLVPSSAGDPNEPEWVDDPGASSMGGPTSGVDDFLDLPSPNVAGVLSARDGSTGALDLPELGDMPATSPVKVVDLQVGQVGRETSNLEDQGIHDGGGDRLRGPIDMGQVGVVEYDEDNDDLREVGPTGTFSPMEIPRRAGSARVGGPGAKKGSSSMTTMLAVLFVLGVGGFGVQRMMQPDPVVVPPPPPRKKNPTSLIDKKAEEEAAAREKAQEDSLSSAAGTLSVETTPRGAVVWVDGVERGSTPLTIKTQPGAHRLVLTKPGFKMLREVADTTEGLTIKRSLPPANINFGGSVSLKVECKTEGVYPVFIDGRDTGLLCPIEDLMIPAGNRLVGLYVIPQNKIWSFEREIVEGSPNHRVIFSY